jgi:hypothetical protein
MIPRAHHILPLLAALLLAPATAFAGGPVFWLGGGGAPCNFANLSTALGAVPQGAVIRIASNQSYDDINLEIADLSVTLEGGWADCAGTPSNARTVLLGAAAANLPVLRVEAVGTARSVRLEHLHLRGGTRSGLEVAGLLDVRLDDTVVSDSAGSAGGGIRVSGVTPQQTVLRLVRSIVGPAAPGLETGNVASLQGGGVHCDDARVQLSGAHIHANQAQFGGGLSLQGCLLNLGGSDLDVAGFGPLTALIAHNTAEFFGGGVYAAQASELSLDTGNARIIVHGNLASRGGGLHLSGAGTGLEGAGMLISSNAAGTFGGGVLIENGASLELQRGDDDADYCAPRARCSRVIDNHVAAGPTAAGSAFQVSAASMSLGQTEITGNTSSNAGQATIHISGGSAVRILNSVLHHNDSGSGGLIDINGLDNNLAISASTIADNISAAQVIRFAGTAGSAGLHMNRSIVWQPGALVHNAVAGDEVTSVCMNAPIGSGIEAATDDPAFVAPGIGDYRLQAGSTNIDACTDVALGDYIDLLGTARPTVFNVPATPFDRGALEFIDEQLFVDGFESP